MVSQQSGMHNPRSILQYNSIEMFYIKLNVFLFNYIYSKILIHHLVFVSLSIQSQTRSGLEEMLVNTKEC